MYLAPPVNLLSSPPIGLASRKGLGRRMHWLRLERKKGEATMMAKGPTDTAPLTRGILAGVIGSLVGTVAMDVVMIVESLVLRLPLDTHLATIGAAVGRRGPSGGGTRAPGHIPGPCIRRRCGQDRCTPRRLDQEGCRAGSGARANHDSAWLCAHRASKRRARLGIHRLLHHPSPGVGCGARGHSWVRVAPKSWERSLTTCRSRPAPPRRMGPLGWTPVGA